MVGSLAGAGTVAIVASPTTATASFPCNRTELWAYISIARTKLQSPVLVFQEQLKKELPAAACFVTLLLSL